MKYSRFAESFVILGSSLLFVACGPASTPAPAATADASDQATLSTQATESVPFHRVLDAVGSSGRDQAQNGPKRISMFRTLTLGGAITHDMASPFPFDEPRSTNVVNDSDGPNSNEYNSRSTGIKITIPIRRWVGPTSGGYLTNASDLIAKGVVSSTFTLRLPTYDVDQDTRPVFDCDGDNIPDQLNQEVDDVYWNGEKVGTFQGANGSWSQFISKLPISKLRFPATPGDTAVNTLEIKVDQANRDVVLSSGAVGCEVWLTEVDWAQVSFKAMSPVVFIHGINNTGTKWANYTRYFRQANIPVATDANGVSPTWKPVALTPDQACGFDSIHDEAAQLVPQIASLAALYGTESIHLIGHSKGGQDSRGILRYYSLTGGSAITPTGGLKLASLINIGTMSGQSVQQRLAVESLTTLNTPHAGSPLADVGLNVVQGTTFGDAVRALFPNDVPSYACALTTQAAWFNTYDPENQRHLNLARRFRTATQYSGAGRTANYTFFTQGSAGAAVTIRNPLTGKVVFSIAPTPPDKALPSDGVVPVWSAIRMPSSVAFAMPDADHSYVAENQPNAQTLISAAIGSGSYNWRLK